MPTARCIQVENFLQATSQLAQTTLRSVLGKHSLDEMLGERDKLNTDLQEILDQQTEAWGVKITTVEIKQVESRPSMIRAIARQAEAERARRAKIINAEGEQQAAQKLVEAAEMHGGRPGVDAAPLSRRAQRNRQRTQLHHRVSVPDRPAQGVHAATRVAALTPSASASRSSRRVMLSPANTPLPRVSTSVSAPSRSSRVAANSSGVPAESV